MDTIKKLDAKKPGAKELGAIEKQISLIWSDVLDIDDIGINDDFFDLGGTSLALISVVMRMSDRFGIPLDTAIVARGATVSSLASCIKEKLQIGPPSTPTENIVAKIWSETLQIDDIGRNDDFFDLGGTSLALISVVMRMSEQLGVPLETSIVAQGATVAALAKSVENKRVNKLTAEAV